MDHNNERKGLFRMLKKPSMSRRENDSTALYSPSAKPARSQISTKIHTQRQHERKEQRDKLINQNRVRTTSVQSSNTQSRSTTPLHSNIKPAITSAKNQILNVIKSRPVSKPPSLPTRPPSVQKPAVNNDTLSTTYTVPDQSTSDLSKSGTISSITRKKLLDEWRNKKTEQDKLKAKKPAFKVGVEPKPSPATLPTSSTFNFSMNMPGATLTRSTSLKRAEPKPVPPSSAKPLSSRPPVRSQSVRQVISKETPKVQVKPKVAPLSRKNTEPEKKVEKLNDFNKEIDFISTKLNSSVVLNQKAAAAVASKKQLEIRIECEDEIINQNETRECLNDTCLNAVQPSLTSSPIKKEVFTREYFEKLELDKRNVKFYRDLVTFETVELNKLADVWMGICESGKVPDDIQGDIRSASGLAKLLIDERFAQFNDLINQCEQTDAGGLLVMCSDLQGFWDMVDVQVKDVTKKFELLTKIKENNYVKTDDMIEVQVQVVEKKAFKPNRNYLRKKDQVKEEEKRDEVVEKPVVEKAAQKVNRLAEFKAKMKAMKAHTDEIEIQIAEPVIKVATPKIETPSKRGARRSVRKSVAFNEQPVEKKYNLRSRPSDLIKFDSPLSVRNGLENVCEEETSVSENAMSPIVAVKKTSKKSIYPIINEDEIDKENEDFFSLDDCPQLTWKTRPSIYPTNTPGRGTPKRSSVTRESTIASSPLLKLALISSQSKRLSVNSLNRMFDKLE